MLAFLLLALAGFASPAGAQACTTEATPLVFGAYDPVRTRSSDAVGSIEVRCDTSNGRAIASVGIGLTVAADQQLRAGTGSGLKYLVTQDAGRLLRWGDGATGPLVARALDAEPGERGVVVRLPVYGRIAPGQWVRPGTYSDTIVVTISF